ncbi:MAG: HalOD1 output domain-containing protein [Halanaeroarchaeum sp.]
MQTTPQGIELSSISHDPELGLHSARYDPETTPPSLAVVALQAAVADEDPTDSAPLFEAIDPDALDAVAAGREGGVPPVRISFEYEGYTVTVDSAGALSIGETESDERDDVAGQVKADD